MKKTILIIAPLAFALASTGPVMADPAGIGARATTVTPASGLSGSADARPIEDLQLAAQRLRDAIHEMLNEPAGPKRAELIASADHALVKVDAAMANLPAGLLIADATNTTWQRTEDRLERASENLNDAVKALATDPTSIRRDESMDVIRSALGETHKLLQRVPRNPPRT